MYNLKPFEDKVKASTKGTKLDSNLIYRLLRTEEKNFLSSYWLDYFHHLRKSEPRSMLSGILDKHPQCSKYLRAHLIDWLMHVCDVLTKDDLTVPFVAVSLMDRYFKESPNGNMDQAQV